MSEKKKQPQKSWSRNNKPLILTIFFAGIAVLYFHNLTRDIYSGDIGDLVTASYVLGVAHPPGYPLFTALGYIFSHLPLPIPVVTKVAFISLFASVTALIFFYRFSQKVLKNLYLSLITTAILAFSYLFWFHAEIPETFALNNLFVVLILYYSYAFHKERKHRDLYILAFFSGLSLTHHHTIVFLFPGVGMLLLKDIRYLLAHWRVLIRALLCAVAGLLPYLYVPFAAMRSPAVNWDSATNLNNFIHLILRKDYGFAPHVVNEVPISVKLIHVRSFLTSLANTYSYQVLIVAVLGIVELFRKDRIYLTSLLISFILTGPFFMYYAAGLTGVAVGMGIIERFYVMPSVIFMFFIPFGFRLLSTFLVSRFKKPAMATVLMSYFLLIPALLLIYNYPKTDLSKTTIGNTLTDNIFSYLPPNAVLFVTGDTTTFNIWYNHFVLGKRPDIDIINPPGVGSNHYFEDEVNTYHKKNPNVSFEDLPSATIEDIRTRRPLFSTYPIPIVPDDSILIPRGLVYEIASKTAVPSFEAYLQTFEEKQRKLQIIRRESATQAEDNLVAAEIPSIYASGLVRVGDFIDSYYKNPAKAEHYYRRALWIDPDHPNANSGLALSLYKAYRDCKLAPESMQTAIDLYPVWKTYYAQLYLIYEGCNAPETTKETVRSTYRALFHEDLLDLVHPDTKR